MILWFIEMSQVLIVRRKQIQYHWVRASNRENLLWVFADWRMKVEDWFWVDTKTSRWLTRCFLLPNTWSQEENQNDFLLFYVFFFLYSSCFIHWWSKMLSSGFGYARGTRVAITIGFVVIMCPNVHNHWMLWESESMKRRNLPGEDSEMR